MTEQVLIWSACPSVRLSVQVINWAKYYAMMIMKFCTPVPWHNGEVGIEDDRNRTIAAPTKTYTVP